MQQNDDEVVYSSLLTKEDYDRIENLVVDLYIELDIKSFPIDPIAIAKQKGYTLIPYSKLNKEEAIGLRRKVISGLNMGQKDGTQYIFYDDSEVWYRQHFTIMHEIGHILQGHREESELADQCANYFATYSLAPSPMIGSMQCEDYIDLANKFGISVDSAAFVFTRYEKWKNIFLYKDYELKMLRHFGIII